MKLRCQICKKRSELAHIVKNYRYFLCRSCTTLFLNPQPKKRANQTYYEKSFSYSAGKENEKLIRKRSQSILRSLKKIFPAGNTILDIGSGYGYFLDEARKKNMYTLGIEPSLLLTKENPASVSVICDSFPSKKLSGKKFDFISIIHVIEHVSKPNKFISSALKHLNKNGVLYIETPNLDSYLYRFEKNQYTFLTPPDHLWLFSRFSFQMLLPVKTELVRSSTYSYPEHFMGIVKHFLKRNHTNTQKIFLSCNSSFNKSPEKKSLKKQLSYLFFDCFIARFLYRFLNINQYGSILELYVRKK